MKIEIKCTHPFAKRACYGPGWMCEVKKGGCGATGSGEQGHWDVVIGYAEMPEYYLPQAEALETKNAKN